MVEFLRFCSFLGAWFRRVPIIVAQPYLVYSFFTFFSSEFLKNIGNFSNHPLIEMTLRCGAPINLTCLCLECVIPLWTCNNIIFLYNCFNSLSLWVAPILKFIFLALPPWAPKILSPYRTKYTFMESQRSQLCAWNNHFAFAAKKNSKIKRILIQIKKVFG